MEARLACMDDVPGICSLYKEFFEYNASQQPQYYKKSIESGKYPKSVIENDTEALFVAADGNALIGLLHIAEGRTPPYDCFIQHSFATIVDLFVKESYRSKGVGRQLLGSAKGWAKSRELDYIELNVLAENENGIRFYDHEEFTVVSQIMRHTLRA
jgi:ribosomal protein S18 acetylase RimI-like enzyme